MSLEHWQNKDRPWSGWGVTRWSSLLLMWINKLHFCYLDKNNRRYLYLLYWNIGSAVVFSHYHIVANISFPLWVSALTLWHFWVWADCRSLGFMIIPHNIIHPSSYLMPSWSLPVLICLLSVIKTANNCTVDCLLYAGKLYRIALLSLSRIN